MSWFKATITESCILGGAFHRLCREFQRAFIAAGAPAEMALFAQTYVLGDSREIYFSPGSIAYVEEVVRLFNASPCAPPNVHELTMVYGVAGSSSFPTETMAVRENPLQVARNQMAMAR